MSLARPALQARPRSWGRLLGAPRCSARCRPCWTTTAAGTSPRQPLRPRRAAAAAALWR